MDRIGELFRVQDGRFWVLIALCVALVYTIQAAETSVDGLWPHQRRPARMTQGARAVAGAWSWVALLLLPGLLLAVLNLAILIQQGKPQSQVQILGALFVAVSWLVFVLVSTNTFGMGRYMGQVGVVGPAALMGMLVVGDVLLLIALLDQLPVALDAVRQLLPSL